MIYTHHLDFKLNNFHNNAPMTFKFSTKFFLPYVRKPAKYGGRGSIGLDATPTVLIHICPPVMKQQARRKRGAGGAVAPQFLAEQLTLSPLGGADYAHHSTTSPPGFSDLATALNLI